MRDRRGGAWIATPIARFSLVWVVIAVCLFGVAAIDASAAQSDSGAWTPAPAPRSEGTSQGGFQPSGGIEVSISSVDAALATATCADGKVCFWRKVDYDGEKIAVDANDSNCCTWRFITGQGEFWRSAKNRTGNRKLQLGNALIVVACLDPGENRPDPGLYDRARIGSQGSRCP